VRVRVRVIVRVCVCLCVCCVCGALRKKHRAFSDPRASNKRCQPSNRHRAIVRGVCCGCTRGVSGVCSGCAQGGGRPSACSVRGTGVRAAGVRGAPQRRMLSAEASGFREYKPGVQRRRGGCLQPPPRRCLHSLARPCGSRCALRAVWVCGCVRLCAAVSGKERGSGGREGGRRGRQKVGRQQEGGRREGGRRREAEGRARREGHAEG